MRVAWHELRGTDGRYKINGDDDDALYSLFCAKGLLNPHDALEIFLLSTHYSIDIRYIDRYQIHRQILVWKGIPPPKTRSNFPRDR